jgi:hypothetical protein
LKRYSALQWHFEIAPNSPEFSSDQKKPRAFLALDVTLYKEEKTP